MFCDNLKGWDGVRDGRWGWEGGSGERLCVCLWLIHADARQKPTPYCKAIILQLKTNLKI